MFLFHPVWTTAMPCFLDFHTTYSRGCSMFRMQQQDSLHRNRSMTMLLRLERHCTGYQLNTGLILKYQCMHTRPNTIYPQHTCQNWSHLTDLQEGWDHHVMSMVWLNIGQISNIMEIVLSKMQPPNCGMSYPCSFTNVIHLQISNIISKHIFLKRHICNILMLRQDFMYSALEQDTGFWHYINYLYLFYFLWYLSPGSPLPLHSVNMKIKGPPTIPTIIPASMNPQGSHPNLPPPPNLSQYAFPDNLSDPRGLRMRYSYWEIHQHSQLYYNYEKYYIRDVFFT